MSKHHQTQCKKRTRKSSTKCQLRKKTKKSNIENGTTAGTSFSFINLPQTRKHINIAASGQFYEKAKSRRVRHSNALHASNNPEEAIALGRGAVKGGGRKRTQRMRKEPAGPNQLAVLRLESTGSMGEVEPTKKIRRFGRDIIDLKGEEEKEKIESFINCGRGLAQRAMERGSSRELMMQSSTKSIGNRAKISGFTIGRQTSMK